MVDWLFVIIYSSLFLLLIKKFHFAEKTGINNGWLIAFLITRILSGIFYGWIHYHLYGEVDTWSNFSDSKIVYSALPSQPFIYLKLVFGINFPPPSTEIAPFASAMTCWNQADAYFMVRFQALCDLFSFAHYNVNAAIFNFIVLAGLLHLYSFSKHFISGKKDLLLLPVFLLPNILFWSSGLAKDGFVLAALGFLLDGFLQLIPAKEKTRFRLSTLLSIIIGAGLLSVLRMYVLVLMLPFLVAFYIYKKHRKRTVIAFLVCIFIFTITGFALDAFHSPFGTLHLITARQQQFSVIAAGNSGIQLRTIKNSFILFAENIPAAVYHVLIGPIPSQSTNWQQILLFIQNIGLLLIYLVCILFRKKEFSSKEKLLLLFCLSLSICWIIVIGETIPNFGAIARYKMPVDLFLLIAALTVLDEKKIRAKFYSFKNLASNW